MTTGCAKPQIAGDAGCQTFGEAMLRLPDEPVPETAWGGWIADTVDQMTGACR